MKNYIMNLHRQKRLPIVSGVECPSVTKMRLSHELGDRTWINGEEIEGAIFVGD